MTVEQKFRTASLPSGIVLEPQHFHPNAMREIVVYAVSSNAADPTAPNREMLIKRPTGEIIVADAEMLSEIMRLPEEERLKTIDNITYECSKAKAIVIRDYY